VLGQDDLSFWLADEARVGEDPEVSNTSLQEAAEDSYAGGYALTELGADDEEELAAVVVYIGESCRSTRAF
jgi:hypothetical protein